MKTHRFCPSCLAERGPVYCSLEITEDDIYEMRCPYNHVTYFAGSQDKYVVLGTLAFEAFIDEYYMQTVAALWTSLERCYEWYLRVVFVDKFKSLDNFESAWGHVIRSSERQFGMFLAVYTSEENEPPPLPARNRYNDLADFRNSVVHQGHVPITERVENYCNALIEIIQRIEATVRYKRGSGEELLRHWKLAAAQERLGIIHPTPLYGMVENPFWINQNGVIRSDIRDIAEHVGFMRRVSEMSLPASSGTPSA